MGKQITQETGKTTYNTEKGGTGVDGKKHKRATRPALQMGS